MDQADEALQSSELNRTNGLQRSAANRAYYAMFYAVLALLATRKDETSRHSGAISRFDQHVVKAGTFPREFSRWLPDAFAQRPGCRLGKRVRAHGIRGRRTRDTGARLRRGRKAASPNPGIAPRALRRHRDSDRLCERDAIK
ncbi:MAG: HEPN domain-containing protein [Longimicrobiales bacterium]